MSCSKIFSGDLPELLNEIIQCFQNDFSTLHSCILVNRLWCRLAIPLLWEDPFSIPTKNYHFIENYLHNLNDDDKAKLNEYGINNDSFPSNILFNYPSFIKCLNTYKVFCSIEDWISMSFNICYSSMYYSKSVRLIYDLLSRIFIENKAHIHTLEVSDYGFNDNILKYLSQIINSQQSLKMISFEYNKFSLNHSLPLKNPNCSNTLKTIIFYNVNFKNIFTLNDLFEQLNVLESIHILYCFSLSSFIQQASDITKPFKLRSLYLREIFQINTFQLLLQKSGNYLENIRFDLRISNELKQQLFELIETHCTKIKFFDLLGFNNRDIYLIFNLIVNIEQSLNYLSINFCKFRDFGYDQLSNDVELSSIVLLNLGQILPPRLEYLSLSLKINTSNFEIFLKNSQNTFIKKLLIRNKMQEGSEDILPYVKEYIMKKKRVKYFAIEEIFFEKCRDLSSLKDEVKEFELYNIKVQKYYDLNIDCYNFIKEMY